MRCDGGSCRKGGKRPALSVAGYETWSSLLISEGGFNVGNVKLEKDVWGEEGSSDGDCKGSSFICGKVGTKEEAVAFNDLRGEMP